MTKTIKNSGVKKKVVLHFPKRLVDQPIISHLIKDYDLGFNILKASVTPDAEGLLVLELSGQRENYDRGIEYLAAAGVKIQSLSRDIIRNEDRCTSCGACITICPTTAFEIDANTRQVIFYNDRCVACGQCIKACPPHAIEIHF